MNFQSLSLTCWLILVSFGTIGHMGEAAGLVSVASEKAPYGLSIAVEEPWSNVFGGSESVFHLTVSGAETFNGRLAWQLSVEGRTVARGESAVNVTPVIPASIEIHISMPVVKPGVIIQSRLSVMAIEAGREIVRVEKPIWIFPETFFGREEWFKTLDISLFDPTGLTAKLFTEAKIPFTEIRNVAALTGAHPGLLVIGEGVSFRDYRGLVDSLLKAASTGWRILCLAPLDGECALPMTEASDLQQPDSVMFRHADIITELDKRLDAVAWKTKGTVVLSGLKLRGDRGPVVAEVAKGERAWPWVEFTFAKERGRLVVCGFSMMSSWVESPTPRFLIVKVLERVSGNKLIEE